MKNFGGNWQHFGKFESKATLAPYDHMCDLFGKFESGAFEFCMMFS